MKPPDVKVRGKTTPTLDEPTRPHTSPSHYINITQVILKYEITARKQIARNIIRTPVNYANT